MRDSGSVWSADVSLRDPAQQEPPYNARMTQPPDSQPKPNPQNTLQIEIPATLEPAYSNFVVIQHSASEFVRAIRTGARDVPDAARGVELQRIVGALQRSAAESREVVL